MDFIQAQHTFQLKSLHNIITLKTKRNASLAITFNNPGVEMFKVYSVIPTALDNELYIEPGMALCDLILSKTVTKSGDEDDHIAESGMENILSFLKKIKLITLMQRQWIASEVSSRKS